MRTCIFNDNNICEATGKPCSIPCDGIIEAPQDEEGEEE